MGQQPRKELRVLGEGLGAEIGAAVLYELQAKSYVPIHDHRGCVITLVDLETKEQETYRYSAFGEEQTDHTLSPWRFSSKRVEEETGLIYFGRRYYSPELGRWLTPDPQGFEDGPNLYAYVHNSPLTTIDPYGLYAYMGFHDGWTARSYNQVPYFPPVTRRDMSACFSKSFQYGMPFFYDLIHLPSSAPMWQRGMLASAAALEIASLVFPAARVGIPLAERSIYHLSKAAWKHPGLMSRTSSVALKKSFRQTGARAETIAGKGAASPNSGVKNVFPKNPKDLLPNLPRDAKGHIYPANNIRIRPEKHAMKPGEIYNPRHHGQHYHVEIRTDPLKSWNNNNYKYYLTPDGYEKGMGTGFIPGEPFPGS